MYKLVACDLDGTLLTPEHRLGVFTQSVLGRLRARGIELLLASGRHYRDIRTYSAQLGGHGCLISSNGAAVHDRQGRLVHCQPLEPECASALIADPGFADVHTNVYRAEEWLVARPEPYLLQYHQDSGFAYRETDLRSVDPTQVLKIFFYGEHARLAEMERIVQGRFGDQVTTTFSLPVTLEVMGRGVSKGAALEWVASQLGIGLAESIAFGDGLNDREMLQRAGKGVLMENADPQLKSALPDLEVIGSNREESVARYLERLLPAN
jgi:Cof subfamily protein (haloacid dehalogenase superfamily)